MLHCDRRWMLLSLLTAAMVTAGHPAKADVVIYTDNGSIGIGSIERHPFYRPYSYRRPTPIFTDRIEDSTLINPVVIGAPIEDSILINPVIVPSSRRTVVVDRVDRRTTLPYLGAPSGGNTGCTYFVSQRPACW